VGSCSSNRSPWSHHLRRGSRYCRQASPGRPIAASTRNHALEGAGRRNRLGVRRRQRNRVAPAAPATRAAALAQAAALVKAVESAVAVAVAAVAVAAAEFAAVATPQWVKREEANCLVVQSQPELLCQADAMAGKVEVVAAEEATHIAGEAWAPGFEEQSV